MIAFPLQILGGLWDDRVMQELLEEKERQSEEIRTHDLRIFAYITKLPFFLVSFSKFHICGEMKYIAFIL